MDENVVLQNWKNQKDYNSKNSGKYKKLYYWFEIINYAFAAITTIILVIPNIYPLLPAITSGIALSSKAISHLFSFQKQWINCRCLTEKLKSEKRKFDSHILNYDINDDEKRMKEFAKNLETIIENGNEFWLELINKPLEENK